MLRSASVIGAAALCASCAAQSSVPASPPTYAAESCSRVALVDAASGERIRGAEDLAVDSGGDRLIVSAHDRRAVARAVWAQAAQAPQGGVYAVAFDVLRAGAGEAAASPLIAAGAVAGGLRPHGVVYIPQTDEIAFVNRGYQKINGRLRLQSNIVRASAREDGSVHADAPSHCAANDLIADDVGLLVSFDHGACDWRRSVEDVFRLRRSGVADAKGAALFDSAAYANGLARLDDGALAIGATRENALLILAGPGDMNETRRIALPGGPDNLTTSGEKIIAAVHPSTMRLAAALRLGLGKAPSRVVKVDPASGAMELLFDDPTGRVFSGATVAVEREGALILGSATDEGLLVCRSAEPARP